MDHIFRPCNAPLLNGQAPCAKIADLNSYVNTNAGITPLRDVIKTGYVTVTLAANVNGEDKTITVGNKSSPAFNNGTFIQTFNVGGSTDTGCDFTIYDSTGGDIGQFLQGLYLNACENSRSVVLVDFGWLIQDSQETIARAATNGRVNNYKWGAGTYSSQMRSFYRNDKIPYAGVNETTGKIQRGLGNRLGFAVDKLEVSFEGEGSWKYRVTCSTLLDRKIMRKLSTGSVGSSSFPVCLKDAAGKFISQGCQDTNGNPAEVVNIWVANGNVPGATEELKFKNSEGGACGPKASWQGNTMSPTSTVRNMLNPVTTSNGAGTVMYTDPIIDAPNLVVIEGDLGLCALPKPGYCGSKPEPLYVYIVNGGNCSPVLSFNPSVTYAIGAKAIGGTMGGGNSSQAKNFTADDLCSNYTGNDKISIPKAGEGEQAQGTIPNNMNMWRFPNKAVNETNKGISENLAANSVALQSSNITGELKIVGNPEYVNMAKCQGWFIGIIFINQPQVNKKNKNAGAPNVPSEFEWLAYPDVNATFSRLDYMILGVSHAIDSNGDYTTTLKVQAVAAQAKRQRQRTINISGGPR